MRTIVINSYRHYKKSRDVEFLFRNLLTDAMNKKLAFYDVFMNIQQDRYSAYIKTKPLKHSLKIYAYLGYRNEPNKDKDFIEVPFTEYTGLSVRNAWWEFADHIHKEVAKHFGIEIDLN